jgi:hypothetical protein
MKPSLARFTAAVLIASTLMVVCAPANAQPRSGFEADPEVKALLIEAVKKGSAKGIIHGKLEALFRDKFKRTEPVQLTATVASQLPVKGCKQLNLRIEMVNAVMTDAKSNTTPIAVTGKLNVCEDGSLPQTEAIK